VSLGGGESGKNEKTVGLGESGVASGCILTETEFRKCAPRGGMVDVTVEWR
jgi:hypothetical protein